MSTILFLTGSTRGNALESVTRGIVNIFKDHGLDAVEVNFSQPNINQVLEGHLKEKNILFAFSFAGIGRDIPVEVSGGGQRNLWDALEIPFIAIHGDSPAYFFDRHVNPSSRFATIYAYREHYRFRKELPHLTGLFGVTLPMLFDTLPVNEINFAAKEKGKLVFLKNGNDPVKLRKFWQENCPPTITKMLFDIADGLVANMQSDLGANIDELVKAMFMEKGMDVEALTSLRLFFVAQLDDYLRRERANMVGEVLSQFPVEIHGDNWDHMDFSGSKCTFVKGADYGRSRGLIRNALGTIDISPNVGGGFHDRLLRAYGMHTLCITNEQDCVLETFGENSGTTYQVSRESLQSKIADVLANPKEYVELGREIARIFNDRFPAEATVQSFIEMADALRLTSTQKPLPGIQDFCVWPPQSIA